jgi:hypothetical protein
MGGSWLGNSLRRARPSGEQIMEKYRFIEYHWKESKIIWNIQEWSEHLQKYVTLLASEHYGQIVADATEFIDLGDIPSKLNWEIEEQLKEKP